MIFILKRLFYIILLTVSGGNYSQALSLDAEYDFPTIQYKENIHISESLEIDTTDIEKNIKAISPEIELVFEWDIKGRSSQSGLVFSEKFNTPGIKEITLSIFEKKDPEAKLLVSSQIKVFVYEKSLGLIVSNTISGERLDETIIRGRENNILLVPILEVQEKNIGNMNISESLSKFRKDYTGYSDYYAIWGEKEFLFSIVSKINQERESNLYDTSKQNLVLLSSFNTNILEGYISNLVGSKNYIETILLLEDSLMYQVQKYPSSISELETNLIKNQFEFKKIDNEASIPPYFFISRFINNLSSIGIATSDIYIIVIIPFLLTMVSFMKHFVGFSPIGISLPLFCSLLCFKFGILFFSILFIATILINIILSYIIGKYNLLYTPKAIFLSIINIVLFMLLFNIARYYSNISLFPSDILYFILYIILAEKLIHIIISKEFREYQESLYITFFIGCIGYMILIMDTWRVFLLAYPELIIILIPLNFFMGRFTGLRVTEYFRFKEVIKNIEE